jgi:hypothetical protein
VRCRPLRSLEISIELLELCPFLPAEIRVMIPWPFQKTTPKPTTSRLPLDAPSKFSLVKLGVRGDQLEGLPKAGDNCKTLEGEGLNLIF